jgi:membrane protease YdiL (CAAX protease family)
MADISVEDPGEDTGWKVLAMCGCGAAAITWLLAAVSVFGRRGNQEGGLTILAMVVVGSLFALALGIAALIGNRKDRPTRRWALLSLAFAVISPVSFVLVLGSIL